MSWSTVSKAADISSRLSSVTSPRSAANRKSETTLRTARYQSSGLVYRQTGLPATIRSALDRRHERKVRNWSVVKCNRWVGTVLLQTRLGTVAAS